MDNEQAKLILSAYRPGGADASDPFFDDALDQARRDPKLAGWLEESRRFDQRARAALAAEHPPHGLRDTILLGARVTAMHKPERRAFWARPAPWVAVAAGIALLLAVAGLLPPRGGGDATGSAPLSVARFGGEVFARLESADFALGKMSGDTAELRSWLASQGAPHDFPIPATLAALDGLGCQVLSVGGAKVSLVCFQVGDGRVAHLFVIDRNALDSPPGPKPSILHKDGGGIAATWSASGRTFLLTGRDMDEQTLLRMIQLPV